MRVLHVTQPTGAGVPTVVRLLARDQQLRGDDVVVASPDDGQLAGWLRQDGVAHRLWLAARNPGPDVLRETWRLRRIFDDVRPDLVHLHSAKAGLAGRLTLRGRTPTVFQPHAWSFEAVEGPLRSATLAWERFAVRWTDLVLCVSEDERDRAHEAGVRGQIAVVPNGVDLERFAPPVAGAREAARRDLALPPGPLVVCVGRLARQKGQDVLLEAWSAVQEQVHGARLVLVGDGPDLEPLRARADPSVVFAGHQDDVRPWLVASDVVALPSRWEAGSSLAVFEAQALQRSVVSTAVAGNAEVLDGCGALVPVDDVAGLGSALVRRLLDPALAAQEGARGRERVEALHDQRTTVEQVRALYGQVLARTGT